MDNLRLMLWLGLGLSLWMGYQAWVLDYPAQPTVTQAPPVETVEALPGLPEAQPAQPESVSELPTIVEEAAEPIPTETVPDTQYVEVQTDVLRVWIDLKGGNLVKAELPGYPKEKDQPDVPVTLLNDVPGDRYTLQTGLRSANGGSEPNHLASYRAAQAKYVLEPGQEQLTVILDWEGEGGITATKEYVFREGQYGIEHVIRLTNAGATPFRAAAYSQLFRRHNPEERSFVSVDSYSFTGPVLFDGDSYEKIDFGDLLEEPITATYTDGWLASIQHHFLAAAVPQPGVPVRYQATARGGNYTLSAIEPIQEVAPGASADFASRLFVGPKLQNQLAATGKGLELTVDYGVLTILAQPLFWVLSKVHGVVGNWGWAIIIVTFLIKLVFYKLTETSGRSMAKMRKLQPRMKQLQERYKDDRQALSQAMMEMYKKEGANPAAGCLPILIQMPFFFAFYWVLIESVEMRQAPFALWITDLSSRDPYFVMPLLMGAAMFFQTKLNPAPPDPVQAKVLQFMPIIFTGMFAFFPSGLVLYWLTNTLLTILQQWNINRIIEGADKRKN